MLKAYYLLTYLWRKQLKRFENNLYLTTEKVHNFEKHKLKQLLMFEAAFESHFLFDGEYYIQVNGFPWDPHWVQLLPMHFYVTMKKMP